MSKETENVIVALHRMITELANHPATPRVRRFEKPDYDSDRWVKCELCGAWDDVNPCDICVAERTPTADELEPDEQGPWPPVSE